MPVSRRPSGVDPAVLSQASKELRLWIDENRPHFYTESFERPFYSTPPSKTTKMLIDQYCSGTGKEFAAEILETDADSVVLDQSLVILYANMKKPARHPPEPTAGNAITILAFDTLNQDNGLPIFGDPAERASLAGGEVLLASGNLAQQFAGKGGGIAHIAIWGRKDG